MSALAENHYRPWLVTLDVDGTILRDDTTASAAVIAQVRRLSAAGHQVMLATGRSPATTVPVVDYLGIAPRFLVCSNGAIVMCRDPKSPGGYRRQWAECFDPTDALQTINAQMPRARFAVEDVRGHYRFTEPIPNTTTIGDGAEQVTFNELLHCQATRVVVVSPDHDLVDFLAVVERMGLHRVSYFIGWTAWMDLAAEGVNKATAMERCASNSASRGNGCWPWPTAETTSNCSPGRPRAAGEWPWVTPLTNYSPSRTKSPAPSPRTGSHRRWQP